MAAARGEAACSGVGCSGGGALLTACCPVILLQYTTILHIIVQAMWQAVVRPSPALLTSLSAQHRATALP